MKNLEKKYVNAAFIVASVIFFAVNIVTYLNVKTHLEYETVNVGYVNEILVSESIFFRFNQSEVERRTFLH